MSRRVIWQAVSVLQTRRRAAGRERPYAVGELKRKETIVLTSGLQAGCGRVQAYLSATPIGASGDPATGPEVIGPGAGNGCPRRVVVSDFFGTERIANIEHADAGTEVTACQRRRVFPVIHAAVMGAIRE